MRKESKERVAIITAILEGLSKGITTLFKRESFVDEVGLVAVLAVLTKARGISS